MDDFRYRRRDCKLAVYPRRRLKESSLADAGVTGCALYATNSEQYGIGNDGVLVTWEPQNALCGVLSDGDASLRLKDCPKSAEDVAVMEETGDRTH